MLLDNIICQTERCVLQSTSRVVLNFSPKIPNIRSAKICSKDAFYAFLFVLSGRFGDSYEGMGDSVCIWETPDLEELA